MLDLDRIPYMSGVIKNVYGFVNLGMAGFVMATIAVRFVFPAVSAEGAAFWIIRSAPMSMSDFLWSKFWIGLVPVFLLTEGLTITANELLGDRSVSEGGGGRGHCVHEPGSGRVWPRASARDIRDSMRRTRARWRDPTAAWRS